MESIDLAESLDSRLGAGHLRDLCLRLKPHNTVAAVREFLERAKGFVVGGVGIVTRLLGILGI